MSDEQKPNRCHKGGMLSVCLDAAEKKFNKECRYYEEATNAKRC